MEDTGQILEALEVLAVEFLDNNHKVQQVVAMPIILDPGGINCHVGRLVELDNYRMDRVVQGQGILLVDMDQVVLLP